MRDEVVGPAGPTTATRMGKFTRMMLEQTGLISTRMLGLAGIETAAHSLESIFNAAQKGYVPLTPKTIEDMNAALGDLRRHVREALADERQPPEPTAVPPAPTFPAIEASLAAAPPPATAALPPVPPAAPSVAPPYTTATPPAASGEAFCIETVRVETRKLDDLLTQVGELSVIQGRARHRLSLMEELLERWAALERGRRKRGAVPSARNDKEGATPMLFGGLLRKYPCDALFDDSARLEFIVNLLEDQVRNVRLLPLYTVFALFPRMVRDLAKAQGKEAEMELRAATSPLTSTSSRK